jgi:hypothetical protein
MHVKPVVPLIMGKSPEEAQLILRQFDLRGKPMGSERSTEYAPGIVSSQDPSAGAPIPQDRFVKYRLAAPFVPEPGVAAPPKSTVPVSESLVRVPPVVGRELKGGLDAISKAGLIPPLPQSVGKERSNRRSGEITRQDPPAKTLVKRGTPVEVWVSVGSTPPPPPPPSPWHWVAAIILGALAATGIMHMIPAPTPKVELVSFKDYGEQQIASSGPLAFALELCPVVDLGDQKLEKVGPLVAAGGG